MIIHPNVDTIAAPVGRSKR